MVRQVEKARMEEWKNGEKKKERYNIIPRGNAFSAKAYTQTITI